MYSPDPTVLVDTRRSYKGAHIAHQAGERCYWRREARDFPEAGHAKCSHSKAVVDPRL
jgi:hypothetical protein